MAVDMSKTLHRTLFRSESELELRPRFEFKLWLAVFAANLKVEPRTPARTRTTTNEVDDLDAVVVLKHGRAPVVTAHHGAVQFDGDTRGRKIELGD